MGLTVQQFLERRLQSLVLKSDNIAKSIHMSRILVHDRHIKVGNQSLQDLVLMPINELQQFFKELALNDYEIEVSKRILIEINNRLDFLMNVGLGYLTLNRLSSTLSGGESQRIKLAAELSKKDTGKTLYILDEPTTGLHFEDVRVLLEVLNRLVDKGNTIIVIEHNLDVIKVADHIIDMGPEGGVKGGEILCTGTPEEIAGNRIVSKKP